MAELTNKERIDKTLSLKAEDEILEWKSRVFHVILLLNIVLVLFLTGTFYTIHALGIDTSGRALIAAVFPAVFIPWAIFCIVRNRRGKTTSTVLMYVVVFFIATISAVTLFDGVVGVGGWILFTWTATIAGILMRPVMSLWIAGTAVVWFFVLLAASYFGIYEPILLLSVKAREVEAVVVTLLCLMCIPGIVNYYSNHNLLKTLKELREAKKELAKYSKSLEVKVEKRAEKRDKLKEEKKSIQAQLVHSSNLASLGTLSAGIAHELNNPLAAILALTQLMQDERLAEEKKAGFLKKIENASKRMKVIIDHLRQFTRAPTEAEWERVDVSKPLKDSMILLEPMITKRGIEIDVDYGSDLPKVWGDPHQLESVFQNLLGNSSDAFAGVSDERQKQIKIKCSKTEKGIQIYYEDNASGIPKENQGKIFDPFFTTKEVGKGTGLGMSILHGIIEAHKGWISFESEEGVGTKFYIFLPQDRRSDERKEL